MIKLINGYGITETTIYSTFKVLSGEDVRGRSASIGRPVSGTYMYILAPDMSLCPIGVVGELYIGGLGVGRGYLGRPDLTKSRFVPDPFRRGHLVYRSGDLTRWLDTGEIEYLGRADAQVKVRGYRVEIPEIEAALTSCSGIGESVVLAEPRGNTSQLIAFFTSCREEDLGALRMLLEQQLPDYMVPSILVQVERIPVTPNGKVDRASLLASRTANPSPERPVASALEKQIAQAWSTVLGIPADRVGADSNFFAVGGDSIGANLVVRLLANHGLPVELLDLFENPTLSKLAALIQSKLGGASPNGAERVAYWDAVAAAVVAPIVGAGEPSANGDDTVTARVSISHPAQLAEGAVRDGLLTAVGVALRMWCGAATCRVGLVQRADSGAMAVTSLVVTIRDLTQERENFASVGDAVRRSLEHAVPWEEAIANPTYRAPLSGALLFFYDLDPVNAAEAFGSLVASVRIADGTSTLTLTSRSISTGRMQLLAEILTLTVRQTIPAAPRTRAARVCLDVQPFNDVFFKDCAHQALVAAVRHFGRDVHPLLASAAALCEPAPDRARGLRAQARYVDRRALDEVLASLGVSRNRSSSKADICEELIHHLSQGALVIVKLDCYFVEQQQSLYHEKHGEHTVLVCGYDQARRRFDMVDNDAAFTVRYRRTTIGFDELRAAHAGFEELFNARGNVESYLVVSQWMSPDSSRPDEGFARRETLETLRLTHAHRDGERAALALLHEDLGASFGEPLSMEHVELLSFTVGEILLALRLRYYQVARILGDQRLAERVDGVVSSLESIHGVLTKMRLSRTCPAAKVEFMRDQLGKAQAMALAYHAAFAEVIS